MKIWIWLGILIAVVNVGCLTTASIEKEYVISNVIKSAGGIDTFREPGFIQQKEPLEGYEDAEAVRAVGKLFYNSGGNVTRIEDLRVSKKSLSATVRDFLMTLKGDTSSIEQIDGREHDFRVWINNAKVVYIEASR